MQAGYQGQISNGFTPVVTFDLKQIPDIVSNAKVLFTAKYHPAFLPAG